MENFEKKLSRLEELSEKIKSPDISLEDAVKTFEEGIKLSKSLEAELSKIESKIQILINTPLDDEENYNGKNNERTPTQIRNEVSSGVRGIVRSNKVSQSGTFPYFDASVGVCTLRTNQTSTKEPELELFSNFEEGKNE